MRENESFSKKKTRRRRNQSTPLVSSLIRCISVSDISLIYARTPEGRIAWPALQNLILPNPVSLTNHQSSFIHQTLIRRNSINSTTSSVTSPTYLSSNTVTKFSCTVYTCNSQHCKLFQFVCGTLQTAVDRDRSFRLRSFNPVREDSSLWRLLGLLVNPELPNQ